MMQPWRKTFSAPVRSWWYPAAISMSVTHATANAAASSRRSQNAREQLEDRRLACAVRPDDSQRLARADRERDVLHRPELAPFERLRRRSRNSVEASAGTRSRRLS